MIMHIFMRVDFSCALFSRNSHYLLHMQCSDQAAIYIVLDDIYICHH